MKTIEKVGLKKIDEIIDAVNHLNAANDRVSKKNDDDLKDEPNLQELVHRNAVEITNINERLYSLKKQVDASNDRVSENDNDPTLANVAQAFKEAYENRIAEHAVITKDHIAKLQKELEAANAKIKELEVDYYTYRRIASAVDMVTNPQRVYPNLSPVYLWVRKHLEPLVVSEGLQQNLNATAHIQQAQQGWSANAPAQAGGK